MRNDQEALDQLYRTHFLSLLMRAFIHLNPSEVFSDAPYLRAIAAELRRVEADGGARLIFNIPPRYLKSITISVAWVAYMLGRDPTLKFVGVSYAADLALKHARDCRSIMMSDWYRRAFPGTQIDRTAEYDLTTTRGGGRLSTSIEGGLTGRGGDIFIIDDPLKAGDAMSESARNTVNEWMGTTLYTRLNNKVTGSIIVVMQRLHEDDLTGHLLANGGGGWRQIRMPAIAEEGQQFDLGDGRFYRRAAGEVLDPARESLSTLEGHKALLGLGGFSAQYQQSPIPAEGLMVQRDWLKFADRRPERGPGVTVIQSWDCASKMGIANDYSVCVTAFVVGEDYYIVDVFRDRLDFPRLRKAVIEEANQWDPDTILIEDAASGTQLLQDLRANPPPGPWERPIGITPQGDKRSRFARASNVIEGGRMFLPRQERWLDAFVHEILSFPGAKHDDQADALAQLLNRRRHRMGARMPGGALAISLDTVTGKISREGDWPGGDNDESLDEPRSWGSGRW